MISNCITQVPNFLFDEYLAKLTESELKIVLIIIRQTIGWIDLKTGKRKTRDRISGSQFRQKTGLSKRIITKAIKSLIAYKLILVTDFKCNMANQPNERTGRSYLYYSLNQPVHEKTGSNAQSTPRPVHQSSHNKNNYIKINRSKAKTTFSGPIKELLAQTNRLLS